MKKAELYYWMDSSDDVACGGYATAKDAEAGAIECLEGVDKAHTRTVTILKAVSVSAPPSLKRTWKAA